MQGGGNRRAGFFDDPFGIFGDMFGDRFGGVFGGGFDGPNGLFPSMFGGGFDGPNGLFPSMFGGRDPFEEPFFRPPVGGVFGGNMLGPTIFDHSPFRRGAPAPGFVLEQEEAAPQAKKSRGPIIEEIVSEEEKEESVSISSETRRKGKEAVNNNKSGISNRKGNREVVIHDNNKNEMEEKSKQIQIHGSGHGARDATSLQQQYQQQQPRSQSFTFQSSTVTYGGMNGAYYTSSTSRRTGSDGMAFEEMKEANSSTGQAAHRVSRAIHGKGHSLTRKLNSDGRVDSKQTLHNMNQDEMGGFESAWRANAGRNIPGLSGTTHIDRGGSDASGSGRSRALPAPEHPHIQHNRNMYGGGGRRGAGGRM